MSALDSTPQIRCTNLSKTFQRVVAVRNVNIQVEKGRFLALLGPSGCGKTTVLRMIAGFETPDTGHVHIAGRCVEGGGQHMPPERRRIGMVFQEYALFPHLTVAENTGFGLTDAPNREARVHEVLELVGLDGVKDRMPHALSGGQQQRVALARALAPKPDVILLDEPFSNLDAALRIRVRQEVRHILRAAGVTAIFVTHDQEEALSLADEVAVMIDGSLVQCATPERLYRRPETHAVATFLGETNFLPATADGANATTEIGVMELYEESKGPVELMFRPEDLVIALDDHGSGVIIEREYFGHDQLLKIRLDSGTIVRSRTVGCCRGMRDGTRVRVYVETPVMHYPAPYGCPVAS
jgi:iron(III) transport system ATP-binding protein